MNTFSKFLNNNRSDLKWWQRNWVFVATATIVLINIIIFAALLHPLEIETDNFWSDGNRKSHWHDRLYFSSLLQVFFSAFSHFTWQHTLLNMLCFLVCGIYLERKLGSVKLFSLIICFAFFGNCAVAANNNSISSHGFSGVNYAVYAYVLVDYLFCVIPKHRRNKLDTIYGGVMLGLIYFAMCFNGGTERVGFSWYPYDAITNLGHYTSYFVGLIIATFLCAIKYFAERKSQPKDSEQAKP